MLCWWTKAFDEFQHQEFRRCRFIASNFEPLTNLSLCSMCACDALLNWIRFLVKLCEIWNLKRFDGGPGYSLVKASILIRSTKHYDFDKTSSSVMCTTLRWRVIAVDQSIRSINQSITHDCVGQYSCTRVGVVGELEQSTLRCSWKSNSRIAWKGALSRAALPHIGVPNTDK